MDVDEIFTLVEAAKVDTKRQSVPVAAGWDKNSDLHGRDNF